MGIKLSSNWKNVSARFENIADKTTRGASQIMEEHAHIAARRAADYAPSDEGNLADAIEVVNKRDGVNGRNTFYVQIDPAHTGTRTRDGVGDYAMYMHEGVYDLGENSRLKDLSIGGSGGGIGKGGRVGRKFLQRAMNDQRKELMVDFKHLIKRTTQ
jgi:hypothetical protein